ncbi:MAG: hypothetical protein H6741_03940 [Alphaproteobacteria bacterium]|nr:hypothetical protein [Alphaproteobacteria bacterium]MCB9791857.1 hypothetical protein [Alphaproteobacteria bacterium]
MKSLLLLVSALALGTSCASECGDPSHINGDYEIFSSVTPDEDASTNIEEMRTYLPFYAGTRDWEIRYTPASGKVTLLIDGQELVANYREDDENCNRFTLTLNDGRWQDSETILGDPEPTVSTHNVVWSADMIWQGDELSGAYTVTDAWVWSMDTESASGTLEASGLMAGVLIE